MPMPIQSPTETLCDLLLPFIRDQDARPTFILRSIKGKPHLAFANKALQKLQAVSPPGTDIVQICHHTLLSRTPSSDYTPVAMLSNRLTKAYNIPPDEKGNLGWLCVMEEQLVPENVRNGEINLRDSEPEMGAGPLVVRSNKVDFPVKRTLKTPLLANVGNAEVIDGTVKETPVRLEYRESPPSPTKVIGVVSGLTGKDESFMDPKILTWNYERPMPVLDWTKGWDGLTEEDKAHFAFLRSIEWDKTGIGRMETWPESLRTIVNAIMPLPNPAVLYMTETGMSIYNEKWKGIAQERHPWLMGASFVQGWPEAVVYFKPILRGVMEGKCVFEENSLFFLQRTLPQEEAYISFSMTPVIGSDGRFLAVLTMAFENTNNVIRKRRVKVIQALSEKLAYVKDLDPGGGFWNGILDSLDENPHDTPFAIVYSVTDDGRALEFMGGRGLPESESDIAEVLDERCDISATGSGANGVSTAVFTKYLKRLNEDAMAFYEVTFTTEDTSRLSKMRYRGFNECESFVVMRIHAHDMVLQTVIVLGLNNRSPLNSPYKRWIANICHATASTVSKARLLQEEVNRRLEDKIAALERAKAAELKARLQRRTQELRESELLFTKTAASIPVGLVQLDRHGSITYANDAWHRLCGLEPGSNMDGWPRVIFSGDLPKVQSTFEQAIADKSTMAMELRIGNDDTLGSKGWLRWCKNTIDPNIDDTTGEVTGYFGTLVDITSIKDAEEFQRQLTIDALERKRQQDNFIDVNPLSAILQSADKIIRILEEFSSASSHPYFPTSGIQDALEAADTILACGEHQKKIIDDILNVSKLDAGLLTVCPVPVMPHLILERAMKIFTPELKSKGILSDFKLTEEYNLLCGKYWWLIDPARLTQILINLLTNAIKFTGQKGGRKEIKVVVDASVARPEIEDNFTTLTADDGIDIPRAVGGEMEGEDAVYLHVHVQDTGIGFSNELRKTLGQRFQQAPKTHVTYGGSGLGIFIARKLAYLLGGELHFDSEEGEGSTFSFFVRCMKCPPPESSTPVPVVPARRATEDITAIDTLKSQLRPSSTISIPPTSPTKTRPPLSRRGTGYDLLIVEDNKLNQTILRKQLDNIGCRTSVANNGLECLEILKEKPEFTVVLMDMEMPVMDGILATQRIRANEGVGDGRGNEVGVGVEDKGDGLEVGDKRRLTIIGTSANARVTQIEEMMGAGMDAVITKPFLIGDLMDKIEEVLEERKRASTDSTLG